MITYDISDDRIRRETRKILYNHGSRVQYSVFECKLTGNELTNLQQQLSGLIEKGDSIRWYPFCAWCREKIVCQGVATQTVFKDYFLL